MAHSEKFTAPPSYTDEELLALWRAADAEVAAVGQSYQIRGRTLTRADAETIQRRIRFYEGRINSSSRGMTVNYPRRMR